MTNEEAIDILKGCKPYGSSEPEKMCIEFDEALNLAIEALKENERLSLLYSDMANEMARLKSMTGESWRKR